jgi:hypothetical protein
MQAASVQLSAIWRIIVMMPKNELQNILGRYLDASCKLTLEYILKQVGSGIPRAIESIVVSKFVSVQGSIRRANLKTYCKGD